MNIDEPVWDHSTFSFNRDRLFDAQIAQDFFAHNDTHASSTDPDARLMRKGKGYAMSQQARKRIEQGFGWVKTIGRLRKLPRVGLTVVRGWVTWNFAAYDLIRLGGIGACWDPSPT